MKRKTSLAVYLFRTLGSYFWVFILVIVIIIFAVVNLISVSTVADFRTETLNTAVRHLKYRIQQVEEITYSIISNKVFTNLLSNIPDASYDSLIMMRSLEELLDNYLYIKSDLSQIMLYSDYLCGYPASSKHVRPYAEFLWSDSFEINQSYSSWFSAFDPRRSETDGNLMTFVWKTESNDPQKVVYIEIDLKVETLQSLLENRASPSQYSSLLMILNGEGQVMSRLYSMSASKELLAADITGYVNLGASYGNRASKRIDGEQYLWLCSDRTSDGMCIAEIIQVKQLVRGMQKLRLAVIAVALFFSLLLLPVTICISKKIKKPIAQLMSEFDLLGKADFSSLPKGSSIMEYDALFQNYNTMVKRLKDALEKLEEDEKRKKDAEIRALQSQINPHFLYNTLDMINWMAQEKGDTEISLLTVRLSRLFRICLSNGNSLIPLRLEIEHTSLYVQIQQTRFDHAFHYEQKIDPALMNCFVPKIIIQPFVENAIIHGFNWNMQEEPRLSLFSCDVNASSYCLVIEDNGIGISKEIIEKMENRNMNRLLVGGYGTKNVNERIQMYFGSEYGVRIFSEESKGTRIVLKLPRNDQPKGEI